MYRYVTQHGSLEVKTFLCLPAEPLQCFSRHWQNTQFNEVSIVRRYTDFEKSQGNVYFMLTLFVKTFEKCQKEDDVEAFLSVHKTKRQHSVAPQQYATNQRRTTTCLWLNPNCLRNSRTQAGNYCQQLLLCKHAFDIILAFLNPIILGIDNP